VISQLSIAVFHGKIFPGYSWPSDRLTAAIPWADISNHPSDYYDSERFTIPVKLQAPALLSSVHVLILSEYLTSLGTERPFAFRQKEEICGRSSVRQADDDAAQTAGDEEEDVEVIEGASEMDASRDSMGEKDALEDQASEREVFLWEKDASEDQASEREVFLWEKDASEDVMSDNDTLKNVANEMDTNDTSENIANEMDTNDALENVANEMDTNDASENLMNENDTSGDIERKNDTSKSENDPLDNVAREGDTSEDVASEKETRRPGRKAGGLKKSSILQQGEIRRYCGFHD
jgi:hypothetical protein